MYEKIILAGATGNLGLRVAKALKMRGAEVVALVREGASPDKIEALRATGATPTPVDMTSVASISAASLGATCMISTLAGLKDVVVDAQTILLQAAVQAGVPRFIPSDFSSDYTRLTPGENRNFDLRRDFTKLLDSQPIAATSIFNGAFAEVLSYNIPLLDLKKQTVGYWEDENHRIEFTTMDDTAAFTAAAALDSTTPRKLHIASFQITPVDLVEFTAKALETPFKLIRMGSLEDLKAYNKHERAAHPEGETELYPSWQQSQYMQSMFSISEPTLDNNRYADLRWTPLADVVKPRF